jgi:hypothetical protein
VTWEGLAAFDRPNAVTVANVGDQDASAWSAYRKIRQKLGKSALDALGVKTA